MARRNEAFDSVLGTLALLAINVLLFFMIISLDASTIIENFSGVIVYASFGIGLFQLLYVITAIILLKKRQGW